MLICVGGSPMLPAPEATKPGPRGPQSRLAIVEEETLPNGLSPLPDEPLPPIGTLGFRVQRYGMLKWGDLFTARQKVALVLFQRHLPRSQARLWALAFDRVLDRASAQCRWRPDADQEKVENIFSRQTLSMVWDFAEAVPLSDSTGSWADGLDVLALSVSQTGTVLAHAGTTSQADACSTGLPPRSAQVLFTDPPYYDAIPYSDLSDFFFAWQKRSLPESFQTEPSTGLSPKSVELVQDEGKEFEGRAKDGRFFEERTSLAFAEGRRTMRNEGVGCVVFAHKSTEGWEALLTGMLRAGLVITASWPIASEMKNRLRAKDSAALATSVHLVCRPRPANAGTGDWNDVKREMEERVRAWMERFLHEGIRGADAVFACIGPALEVFSRYDVVETAAGHPVGLGPAPQFVAPAKKGRGKKAVVVADPVEPHERGFLAYVFEAVSREALRQVLGDADTEGFEEDARLTALFLWTIQSTKPGNGNGGAESPKSQNLDDDPEDDFEDEVEEEEEDDAPKKKAKKGGFSLPFDTFIRLTRPMGIHYPDWEGRTVEIEKGVVHLIPLGDRDEFLFGQKLQTAAVKWASSEGQIELFGSFDEAPAPMIDVQADKKRGTTSKTTGRAIPLTTLDRVHRAMLLFSSGQTTLLRNVLEAERSLGRRFEKLALALTALYPDKSPERRALEGMQAMMKR